MDIATFVSGWASGWANVADEFRSAEIATAQVYDFLVSEYGPNDPVAVLASVMHRNWDWTAGGARRIDTHVRYNSGWFIDYLQNLADPPAYELPTILQELVNDPEAWWLGEYMTIMLQDPAKVDTFIQWLWLRSDQRVWDSSRMASVVAQSLDLILQTYPEQAHYLTDLWLSVLETEYPDTYDLLTATGGDGGFLSFLSALLGTGLPDWAEAKPDLLPMLGRVAHILME